jgi:hypothetical protein
MQVVTPAWNCTVVMTTVSTLGPQSRRSLGAEVWEGPLGRCCLRADGLDKGGGDNMERKMA